MVQASILIVFFAGIVSFFSPCILPIVPGFLGYLAGTISPKEKAQRRVVFFNSLFYVLGFTLVFSLIGILFNTVLSGSSYIVQTWLARIGGILIIIFGLHLTGLVEIPYLKRSYTVDVKKKFKITYLNSFLFGVVFAVGWTPCVGVVLGSILTLAITQPGMSFILLFIYSLGLGIPFLIVGLFLDRSQGIIKKIGPKMKYYNWVIGGFLIILGILVFTQNLNLLANFSVLNKLFIGN
ncbi:cytochrome C biogenesis protein [archaeon]|nr:cytochrome C biogenesis protein [archaeon]PJC45309.1 MAG: cytochrome C biogenesis protein [Candidatus Pacearchaeota archaeon CG_4_9_14_0_2_um_filter_30_8]